MKPASRFVVAVVAALIAVWAAPAAAHVEVHADNAQAGATNVTVSFSAEAESNAAGIRQIDVQLPAGIPPGSVTLVSAPTGWTFTSTPDGFRISGPTLPLHTDAPYSIKIAQLPTDTATLPFKTIVTYGNGDTDNWVEIPVAGAAEPPHPAPVLTLAPASITQAPTTAVPTLVTGAPTPSAAAKAADDGGAKALWWLVGVVALIVVVLAVLAVRRRRAGAGGMDDR
jgi:uncharacterized protein YcnI